MCRSDDFHDLTYYLFDKIYLDGNAEFHHDFATTGGSVVQQWSIYLGGGLWAPWSGYLRHCYKYSFMRTAVYFSVIGV